MKKRKPYKRKPTKPTIRRRTTDRLLSTCRQKDNKVLDVIAKIIRLAVLMGICGLLFIVYLIPKKQESSGQFKKKQKKQKLKKVWI